MMKKTGYLALIAIVALMASACTFQFTTQINDDGSGAQIIEFGATTEEQDQLQTLMAMGAEAGQDVQEFSMEQLCQDDELLSGMPVEASMQVEEREDGDWCVARREFANIEELRQIFSEGDMGLNTLEMTEDSFVFDLDFDLADMAQEDISSLEAFGFGFDFVFKLQAPGNAVDYNADEYDEATNTYTWYMEPGAVTNIHVETDLSTFPMTLVIGIAVGVAVLALVVMAVIYFSRRDKTPPSEATTLPPME
ncbi:MAG: hypothetical protein PVG63_08335 [Anaerolineales bacterium]